MTDFWKEYQVKEGEKVNLKKWDTSYEGVLTKEEVYAHLLPENGVALQQGQARLFADNRYGVLIVLQAMDAAGKDGLIKRVFTYLNPQGTVVTPFKVPTRTELDHDYLWRCNLALPSRGNIAIFNRSHYEDVLVTQVHNLVEHSQLPEELVDEDIWKRRYEEIKNWETYLVDNGIVILKFFLHVSKEEQAERLLDRIEQAEKNWKFSDGDIQERAYWADYQRIYEKMMSETSTKKAPWFIIPADRKWYTRYVVSEIVKEQFDRLKLSFPTLPKAERAKMDEARAQLRKDLGLADEAEG